MRRLISALAALLVVGASAGPAHADEVQVIHEHGMPVSIARAGYRYRSALAPTNRDTIQLDGGARVEVWKIDAQPGECLDLTMRSEAFDSMLVVYSRPGFEHPVTADDDSGGGTRGRDARTRFTSRQGGTYYIVAAPARRDEPPGQYTLEIQRCGGGGGGDGPSPGRAPAPNHPLI